MKMMMNLFILLVIAANVAVISGIVVDEAELKQCAKEAVKQDCEDDNGRWMQHTVFRRQCNATIAFDIAGLCTLDEETVTYCGETQYYVQDISEALSTCADEIYNVTNECSAECKNALEALRDALGCCINVFLNTTESPAYPFYRQVFGYPLWKLCDVQTVETCPIQLPNGLGAIAPQRTCSATELAAYPFEALCIPSILNDDCKSLSQYYRDLCSVDDKGEYCINRNIASHYTSYINSIPTACNDTRDCSTECKNLLQGFRNDLGCCANSLHNSTFGFVTATNARFLENNDLFMRCSVEPPPSQCEVKGLRGSASKNLPIGIFSLLLLLIVTIFF